MELHSQSVQQFFVDYFKTLSIKGSYINSVNPCYSDTTFPRFTNTKTWQQQSLDKWTNHNVQQCIASMNGIIMENNYLKYCLHKAQTTKLCDVLGIRSGCMQRSNETITTECDISKACSEDGEIGLQDDEFPKDFLHDFLHLMDATRHLPIKTQNIVVLHFASEYREQMNL